jgi:chromosome segregation ATPase
MSDTKTPGRAFWDAYIAAHPYGRDFESYSSLADDNRAAIEAGVAAAWGPERDRLKGALEENERLAARIGEMEGKLAAVRRERDEANEQEDGTARAYDNVTRQRDELRKRVSRLHDGITALADRCGLEAASAAQFRGTAEREEDWERAGQWNIRHAVHEEHAAALRKLAAS